MDLLPGFIVQEILGYVNSNLQLACSKWRRLMKPYIFELYPGDFASSQASDIFYELDHYGVYVKVIQYPVPSDLLEGVIRRCPNLSSLNVFARNEEELNQVARAFGSHQIKLKVLQFSLYTLPVHIPESLSMIFYKLTEMAVILNLVGALTRESLPGLNSFNLRTLRMDIALFHFSFLQSIPDRFPQLKNLSIVGQVIVSTLDRRHPPAFHNLKLLELELYDENLLDPLAFLGAKRIDLDTLYFSTHCSIDHSKVVTILKKPWPSLRSLTLGGFGPLELTDFAPLFQLTHLHLDFINASFNSLLGPMLEAMPNLKSLQLAAGLVDSTFEGVSSPMKLSKLTLIGKLELGTLFIRWLIRLPYLQKLAMYKYPNFVFDVKVDPASFGFDTFPSLITFDLPEPSAFSDFLLQRSPSLHFPNFISEDVTT